MSVDVINGTRGLFSPYVFGGVLFHGAVSLAAVWLFKSAKPARSPESGSGRGGGGE